MREECGTRGRKRVRRKVGFGRGGVIDADAERRSVAALTPSILLLIRPSLMLRHSIRPVRSSFLSASATVISELRGERLGGKAMMSRRSCRRWAAKQSKWELTDLRHLSPLPLSAAVV